MKLVRKFKQSNMAKRKQPSKAIATPPHVIQRAAKLVLSGKCQMNRPTYLKLKRHRNILRKLASMKGSTRCKKAFITRNRKQIGGFLPFLLPLIGRAFARVVGPLVSNLVRN